MCFLYYFQQHNQILENIFQSIFWNATRHLKIFSFPENSIKYFPENILHEPNTALTTTKTLTFTLCSLEKLDKVEQNLQRQKKKSSQRVREETLKQILGGQQYIGLTRVMRNSRSFVGLSGVKCRHGCSDTISVTSINLEVQFLKLERFHNFFFSFKILKGQKLYQWLTSFC